MTYRARTRGCYRYQRRRVEGPEGASREIHPGDRQDYPRQDSRTGSNHPESGRGPDDCFPETIFKRAEVGVMSESMTGPRLKNILVRDFRRSTKASSFLMCRNPTFYFAQTETTMRHLYLDKLSCSIEAECRIAMRGVAISVTSVVSYN